MLSAVKELAGLVGRVEIAELLKLSRQRVHELTQRKDFPEPLGQISGTTIWQKDAIITWAKQTGRL